MGLSAPNGHKSAGKKSRGDKLLVESLKAKKVFNPLLDGAIWVTKRKGERTK